MGNDKPHPEETPGNTVDGALKRERSKHISEPPGTVRLHENVDHGKNDPIYSEAKKIFDFNQEFPVTFLQRKFQIGFGRATKLYQALSDGRNETVRL